QFFLDRQQRFVFDRAHLFGRFVFDRAHLFGKFDRLFFTLTLTHISSSHALRFTPHASRLASYNGWFDPMEKAPRDQKPYTDHKTKQTDDIDRRQFSYTLFPEFTKIRHCPD